MCELRILVFGVVVWICCVMVVLCICIVFLRGLMVVLDCCWVIMLFFLLVRL